MTKCCYSMRVVWFFCVQQGGKVTPWNVVYSAEPLHSSHDHTGTTQDGKQECSKLPAKIACVLVIDDYMTIIWADNTHFQCQPQLESNSALHRLLSFMKSIFSANYRSWHYYIIKEVVNRSKIRAFPPSMSYYRMREALRKAGYLYLSHTLRVPFLSYGFCP